MNESESTKVSVGIDVSKSMLDIAIHETGEGWSCSNDASGAVALVDKLRQLKPTRIVLEATGGFVTLVTAMLSAARLPAIVVNPPHGGGLAKNTGQFAKTDRIYPRGVGHLAAAIKHPLR